MLLAAVICTLSTFTFRGGADIDMVLATGQALATDVCMMVDPTRSFPKADVEYKSLAELRNALGDMRSVEASVLGPTPYNALQPGILATCSRKLQTTSAPGVPHCDRALNPRTGGLLP